MAFFVEPFDFFFRQVLLYFFLDVVADLMVDRFEKAGVFLDQSQIDGDVIDVEFLEHLGEEGVLSGAALAYKNEGLAMSDGVFDYGVVFADFELTVGIT